MNRDELDLYTADVEANERLTAAKNAYRDNKNEDTLAEFRAAKQAIYALRSEWRTIRAAFTPDVVIPTITTKAGV